MTLKKTNPTVVFPAPKKVVIEPREIPSPKAGEALIQTRCSLISIGTELTVLGADFPEHSAWADYAKYPYVAGYNNIGEVVAVGAGGDRSLVGRRVANYGAHACYVTCPVSGARVIQREIPDEQAVFFTIGEIVMNGIRRGAVQWGEAVAVYGLGLLGQMAVRFCRLCGARPVLAIDTSASRLQRLPRDHGIIPVNPRLENVAEAVKKATRGRQVDVAFEVTGNADVIPDEVRIIRPQGRLVVLSSPRGKTAFDFHDLCNRPSITIIGAHNMSHPPQATLLCPWTNCRHTEMFFDLIADGELDVTPLISQRAPFTEAPQIYIQLLQDRSEAMGIVLNWQAVPA